MPRWFLILLSILFVIGCASRPSRKGVISQELPLTLQDLAEIKAGEKNYEEVLEEYRVFPSPKLEAYVNTIAANVAAVSTRPHLPYHVVFLDDDEVNVFGGPGGYIYMTRGLLNFVESESELAGILAHEIGHISHYEYSNIPQHTRIKFIYSNLMKGSEMAKDSIGTYGTAMHYGLKGIGKAAPVIARRFSDDQEIHADEKAVEYMLAAGYDPRGFQKFIDRLSRVEMGDVNRFVLLMNTHPPFQDRRAVLKNRVDDINFESGKIEFKKDTLGEVRQIAVNASDSIVFEPEAGVARSSPFEFQEVQPAKDEKVSPPRKRWGWF